MAAIFRAAANIPVPQFATFSCLVSYSRNVGRYFMVPEMVPWAFTGLVGGMWFVWPALDDEWKQSWGMGPSPEVVAPVAKEKPQLDAVAMIEIETAHKAHVEEVTEAEKQVIAEIRSGDFHSLEKSWEADMNSFMKTIDEEDEDDEEEDEDEEENEDEADDGEEETEDDE